jgi:ribosomal protein L14E/L6E/L27E
MKPGRVVILLAGRHAGKKAIIVRQHDDGKKVSAKIDLLIMCCV